MTDGSVEVVVICYSVPCVNEPEPGAWVATFGPNFLPWWERIDWAGVVVVVVVARHRGWKIGNRWRSALVRDG